MDNAERTALKHRVFTFKTSASWTTGAKGTVSAEGKPPLEVTAPAEFKGAQGLWSPEEMFVASVEICHMATFLSYAARHNMPILSYKSRANGVLEHLDGDYRFTRIVIFPSITVAAPVCEKEVYATLVEAQKHCLVANSIASIVEVSPTIIMQ
jgi:organic hydroperoxide reductase OsmC/OhrA